jgi:hypothetical protein
MRSAAIVVLLVLAALVARQESATAGGPRTQYDAVAITPFTVADGLDVPSDYLVSLMQDIVSEVQKTKKFRQVHLGDDVSESESGLLRISGNITQFDKGNRAARYFVGFGAGRSKIQARVTFTDAKTHQLLLEDDVDGKVVMGAFGGDGRGATRGLAKELAKLAKRRFAN